MDTPTKSFPFMFHAEGSEVALKDFPVEGLPNEGEVAAKYDGDWLVFYNWLGDEVRIRFRKAKE